jgi:hypothetical protein
MFNEEFKAIGVMVERDVEFMPVVTIREENTWADAYNQYMYNQKYQNSNNLDHPNSYIHDQNGKI